MLSVGSKAVVALCAFALMPEATGRQDLAALMTRPLAIEQRAHLIASPFGTIHAALFTFPRLTGAEIPEPVGYRLASLDANRLETTGSVSLAFVDTRGEERPTPDVNRALKGDRLVPRAPAERGPQPGASNGGEERRSEAAEKFTLASLPSVPVDLAGEPEAGTKIEDDAELAATVAKQPVNPDSLIPGEDDVETARIYFGAESMGGMDAMQPWAPGEGSMLRVPGATDYAALPPPRAPAPREGQSVASKGEVTGADQRPKSPAERLGLVGRARTKAEKCLADAVYFESRGESVRGQIAVAQVVMNRVFSGYYPDTVCGVVYQNAHRRLACQFTFACDGIPDRVNEPDAWTRAKQIAHGMLEGKLWLPDVGKATHYHAYWVHPWWVRTMRKLDKIGVHTFYRPRKWGDGADEPIWGDAAETKEAVNKF